ncbi:MAG: DNA primase [Desulfosarcinaceae bacterium]|nr:DNA primase [Desulfosarcinaceae bacterium]
MASLIPEDKIQEIRTAADIVQVVGDRVALKKAGKNFVGLCPFHAEKTPSFTVSPDKQMYHCFGCGAGGNVIGFLMKADGLTFPEAVKNLAQRLGIRLPTGRLTPAQKRRISEREQLLAINAQAERFFHHQLVEAKAGGPALAYLVRRGMTRKFIAEYQLGYALDAWDRLLGYLKRRGFPPQMIAKTGLAVPRKQGDGFYDRFRHRVIFPIRDLNGQVLAFGGRVLGDDLPKYINGPETAVYHKSRTLYGMDRARSVCRQEGRLYIVEGYFDALSLHLNGIVNAVATLGTSLTSDHVQMIRGYMGEGGQVVLVYDSDAAGLNAARRSIQVFKDGLLEPRILVLPAGHDPDSYVMEAGADRFQEAAGKTLAAMDFLLEQAIAQHGMTTTGKMRIVKELSEPLAALEDSLTRAFHVQKLAERLGIDEAALMRGLPATRQTSSVESAPIKRETDTAGILSSGRRIERQIISMMLQYPQMIAVVRSENLLDQFESPQLKALGATILELELKGTVSAVDVMERSETPALKRLVAALAMVEEHWDQAGCERLLTQFRLGKRKRHDSLIEKIRAAEAAGDMELLQRLLREKQRTRSISRAT